MLLNFYQKDYLLNFPRSAENAVEKEGGKLAGVEHSCVVKYFGYMQDETIWVIMEFCSKGSLLEILKTQVSFSKISSSKSRPEG